MLGGRYRLVAPIARGGMAEVWEAYDDVLSRQVAIKILQAHLAEDGVFLERFRREAVTAARLTHPNIVATFDTGFDGGTAYIVMELIKGRNLRQLLRDNGRLEPWQAVAIARQVADALVYAHQAGLIHRDIKPANCLLVEDEWGAVRVKVADFGIAKVGSEGGDLTKTGVVLGTPKYLSPEQIRGMDPDQRADLYALGVVLYEMLTGDPPFSRDSDMATAMAHIQDKAPRPSSQVKGIPSSLEKLVGELLAKNPDRRIPTAAVLRQRLDALGPMAGPRVGGDSAPGRWRGIKPRFDNGSTPTGTPGRSHTPVPPLPETMVGPVIDIRTGRVDAAPTTAGPRPTEAGPRPTALGSRPTAANPLTGPPPPPPPLGRPRSDLPGRPPVSVPFDGPSGGPSDSTDEMGQVRPPARRYQRSERTAGLVVLALALIGVLVAAGLLAAGGGHSGGGSQPSPGTAATKIALVSVFMANSRPPDNPADTVFTFDGNPSTYWSTDQYHTATFSGLYPGIGLDIELAAGTTVHDLTVTSPTSGWTAQTYVSTTPIASGQAVTAWGRPTDTKSLIPGNVVFSLGNHRDVQYVLLWITNLGPPPHQVQVAELRVS